MKNSVDEAVKINDLGIIVFDGIERQDFEAPLAVFGWVSKLSGGSLRVHLLSKDGKPVRDHLLGRSLLVDGSASSADRFDLFIVPGGDPAQFAQDADLIGEVRRIGSARPWGHSLEAAV